MMGSLSVENDFGRDGTLGTEGTGGIASSSLAPENMLLIGRAFFLRSVDLRERDGRGSLGSVEDDETSVSAFFSFGGLGSLRRINDFVLPSALRGGGVGAVTGLTSRG